jgi:hypothetical protein
MSTPRAIQVVQQALFNKLFEPWLYRECLRVKFLLKNDSSGYPRDAEVTLFTLANPESSHRFNTVTHWSAFFPRNYFDIFLVDFQFHFSRLFTVQCVPVLCL